MAIGDIRMIECKVGDMDLNDPSVASFDRIDIVESLNTYGPSCNIKVVDGSNARSRFNINGSYDQNVSIKFTNDDGKIVGFKFKQFEGAGVSDYSQEKKGSAHNTQYDIKCVSAELLNAQGNYVEKSWEDKPTNICKQILQENYKTKLPVTTEEESEKKVRWISGKSLPLDELEKLTNEQVASKSKSSTFCIFQEQKNGNSEYKITTFEKRFKQSPVATIKLSTVLDSATEEDKKNSCLWFNVGSNFLSPIRHATVSSEESFNLATHKTASVPPKKNKFDLPDKEIYSEKTKHHKVVPQRTVYSKLNQPEPIRSAEAKANRAEFLATLGQNYAECEVIGNPDITMGSMVNFMIPERADGVTGFGKGESQFSGKCMVVGIRHVIRPMGQSPRYTQVLKLVKASFKESSGGAA
jgi:hypothetical protein